MVLQDKNTDNEKVNVDGFIMVLKCYKIGECKL